MTSKIRWIMHPFSCWNLSIILKKLLRIVSFEQKQQPSHPHFFHLVIDSMIWQPPVKNPYNSSKFRFNYGIKPVILFTQTNICIVTSQHDEVHVYIGAQLFIFHRREQNGTKYNKNVGCEKRRYIKSLSVWRTKERFWVGCLCSCQKSYWLEIYKTCSRRLE